MPLKEIARELQGKAANLALRMPIAWVNILAGAAGHGGWPHAGWPHPMVPAVAGAQRPAAGRDARAWPRPGPSSTPSMPLMAGRPAPVGEIVDRTIEGPAGRLRIRIYRPAGIVARLLPTILYFHGGGWTIGSLEAYDLPCRFFCARTGCAVVAVDYRLAPEHKFPAAIDDAVAAYRWLAAEAVGLGIDPARIVVAGNSAGGNIAAVAARLLRDEARPPCLQWLIYPVDRPRHADTPSHASCGEGFLLTRAGMEWSRGHYLNDPSEVDDPRVSPLRANGSVGPAAGADLHRGLRSAARRGPGLCRPPGGSRREDHPSRVRFADPRLCRHAGRLAGGGAGDGRDGGGRAPRTCATWTMRWGR